MSGLDSVLLLQVCWCAASSCSVGRATTAVPAVHQSPLSNCESLQIMYTNMKTNSNKSDLLSCELLCYICNRHHIIQLTITKNNHNNQNWAEKYCNLQYFWENYMGGGQVKCMASAIITGFSNLQHLAIDRSGSMNGHESGSTAIYSDALT